MPPGRPPFEITKEVIEIAESYASRGLNREQIADALGISYQTLNEKTKENSDFSDAIKRGKAKGIAHVANNLLKNVDNGNVTAQIFFLKCHAKWKETSIVEHTGEDGKPIKLEQTQISAQDRLKQAIDKALPIQESKEDVSS